MSRFASIRAKEAQSSCPCTIRGQLGQINFTNRSNYCDGSQIHALPLKKFGTRGRIGHRPSGKTVALPDGFDQILAPDTKIRSKI
jgi:hypothetical protein